MWSKDKKVKFAKGFIFRVSTLIGRKKGRRKANRKKQSKPILEPWKLSEDENEILNRSLPLIERYLEQNQHTGQDMAVVKDIRERVRAQYYAEKEEKKKQQQQQQQSQEHVQQQQQGGQ